MLFLWVEATDFVVWWITLLFIFPLDGSLFEIVFSSERLRFFLCVFLYEEEDEVFEFKVTEGIAKDTSEVPDMEEAEELFEETLNE